MSSESYEQELLEFFFFFWQRDLIPTAVKSRTRARRSILAGDAPISRGKLSRKTLSNNRCLSNLQKESKQEKRKTRDSNTKII